MAEIISKRYELTKLIGKGGMAEVYLAWDNILNREVALKILKSDMSDDSVALERFAREAGATTRLSHPNIVDVYDVGDDGDKHYIVMEYVKGYTLKQLIRKRGAIPYKEAVWMMKQIAGALLEAHKNEIIHRDVKSQNVLIKPDGTIKLSDFGIAVANDSIQITSKDSVLGSVHYLAPELSRGKHASMQSDIYSLGIVFYELLTGDVPFKADTPVQVALKHVKENIPNVRSINPEIPQSVANIITKATAKSLSNRYKNVALMLKDLNECLSANHKNDSPVVLDDLKEKGVKQTISLADENNKDNTKKRATWLFVLCAIVLAGFLIFGIMVLSGGFGEKIIEVDVPNIINMSVQEANDCLSNFNLELDVTHIDYELSDTIEKNRIIEMYPAYGETVQEGSKIRVVVSKGIAGKLKNYVGKDYQECIKELEDLNFAVRTISEPSDSVDPGIVIKQSIEEGFVFDPSERREIIIYYSEFSNIILEYSYRGQDVDAVVEDLKNKKIASELKLVSKNEFTEEELLNCGPHTVVKTEPELGTSYTQGADTRVIIYYFEGE